MTKYVAAVDQGTTSSRFMIFDHAGQVVAVDQEEFTQIYPKPGWVEHDPMEILKTVQDTIERAMSKAGITAKDLAAVGVTNQRETTVLWNRHTGKPYYNAIVWQDVRTDKIVDELAKDGGQGRWAQKTGLPLTTYFSSTKVRWILENVPGVREAAEKGDVLFGNIDTWVMWNLTGGPNGGLHMTDVSNASRTQMMDIHKCEWDDEIVGVLGAPKHILPKIMPSSGAYGECKGALEGVPWAGDLGDQQAAVFGQTCYNVGEAKNTYGTALCLLMNTGTQPVFSSSGLLTTVGYKIGDGPVYYILEGVIAIGGATVQWLRDNLGMISRSSEIEDLAKTVEDNGGIYFVPAFSGLFAPYWKTNARGVIVGLTRYVNKAHFARAVLEATAYQVRELIDAMNKDWPVKMSSLRVDGGMVYNDLLMQFQSDILDVPLIRPKVAETTALGAAYAAGLATGYWKTQQEMVDNWAVDKTWEPKMGEEERERLYRGWLKAVTRTFDWIE